MKDIKDYVKDFYQGESSAHDFFHLERVERIARYISHYEGGNLEVIVASCYLHDIDRHLEGLKATKVSHKEAEKTVREHLGQIAVNPKYHDTILEIISYTSQYSFSPGARSKLSLEAQIVRDADNIDALGAIGVARSFVYGGKYDECIWNPTVPFSNKPYESGAHCPSVIHHYYEKLLLLKDDFDTETGKRLARSRHAVIEQFLSDFFEEWHFNLEPNNLE
ncbi:metal-dependent phosphohydrolase [Geotalea daltonii FRC-32]|uniref:Metal-dependent phosphohydrolase n=1 Tax=Geotalea daltonii (strain DSM 22248 / JCM 15807 / FRC-32) TaxID=316067 RepID=B9LZY1_GEODF|nr:HD domain-containing protein [Geotalea daltonii]ACM20761.1 metal-dependent phosphohydrolase [Geotalea daltonii FRC-32]